MSSLKSRFPEITAEVRVRMEKIARDGAGKIADRAKENVSRGPDPHHIEDDIHVQKRGPAEYAAVAGKENTFYGHMLEYGTTKHGPHPFLMPAAESSVTAITAEATAALKKL